MTINNLPGAIWPILFGAIYAGLQVWVSAQWPEAPPATVLGIMTALGVLMGAVKVLWPQPKTPSADANLPPGASAQAGLAAPGGASGAVRQPGKVQRFFV